jgi:hypothetical protein
VALRVLLLVGSFAVWLTLVAIGVASSWSPGEELHFLRFLVTTALVMVGPAVSFPIGLYFGRWAYFKKRWSFPFAFYTVWAAVIGLAFADINVEALGQWLTMPLLMAGPALCLFLLFPVKALDQLANPTDHSRQGSAPDDG